MNIERDFLEGKKSALTKLQKAQNEKKVDKGILPILNLGKWHRIIHVDELFDAAKKAKRGQIWFLAQSPIIHINTKTNEAADRLLKTAIACGFKNSGIKSLGRKIVVEVCSTERFDAPVGKDGVLFCNNEHLELLTDISNEILKKSTQKLKKFEKNLGKVLSTHKTTNN